MNLVRILILFFLIFMALKQKNKTKDILLILTGLLAVCMVDQEGYENTKGISVVDDSEWTNNKEITIDSGEIFDFSQLPDNQGDASGNIAGYFVDNKVLKLEPGKTDGIQCMIESNTPGTVKWRYGMDNNDKGIANYTNHDTLTLGPGEIGQLRSMEIEKKIDTLLMCGKEEDDKTIYSCPKLYPSNLQKGLNPINTCNQFLYGSEKVTEGELPPEEEIKHSRGKQTTYDGQVDSFQSTCCVVTDESPPPDGPAPPDGPSPPSNLCGLGWWEYYGYFSLFFIVCGFAFIVNVFSVLENDKGKYLKYRISTLILISILILYETTTNIIKLIYEDDCDKSYTIYDFIIRISKRFGIDYRIIIYGFMFIEILWAIILILTTTNDISQSTTDGSVDGHDFGGVGAWATDADALPMTKGGLQSNLPLKGDL